MSGFIAFRYKPRSQVAVLCDKSILVRVSNHKNIVAHNSFKGNEDSSIENK